jgi:transposase
LRRNRGVGPKGQPVYASNNDSLSEHYAVTLMIGLHDANVQQNPVFLEYRIDGMNTSLDFCKFVVKAVTEGFLVPGDVLVCDNAKVHKSPFMTVELNAWLAQRTITIVYLPTYSPELNPCEMVFGFVKNSLRISRNSNNAFFDEVNERFHHQITRAGMERFYLHCLDQ